MANCQNLNKLKVNHPWADYTGTLEGKTVAVAVRTRLNWQKPRGLAKSRINGRFDGAGARKAEKAIRLIRPDSGLEEVEDVTLLWLAIAVDLDNTYEAYWGHCDEMSVIKRKNDNGLSIRMELSDRTRYLKEGRRLCWRNSCDIPWIDHPDEWASVARAHYLELVNIPDREQRIETAIRASVFASTRALRHEDDITTPRLSPCNLTRRRMANRLEQGHPVPVCMAVLDCLSETKGWMDMDAINIL